MKLSRNTILRLALISIAMILSTFAHAYTLPSIVQDQQSGGYSLPIGDDLGQSFTAQASGHITHIGLNTNGGYFDIEVYVGDGDLTATRLYRKANILFSNKSVGQVDLHALVPKVRVTAGQRYTFRIINVSPPEFGTRLVGSFRDDVEGTDAYTGGRRYTFGGPDDIALADMVFQVRFATDLEISGNGTVIIDGDSTPSSADHTDFGSVFTVGSESVTRTFTVRNNSSSTLALDPVVLSTGTHFTVTSQVTSSLSAGQSASFEVTFDPEATGSLTDTISLTSSGGPTPYSYSIAGNGKADTTAPVPVIDGPNGPVDSSISLTVDFGEEVTGFTVGDITVGNAIVTQLNPGTGGRFFVYLDATADGTVTVDIDAGVAFDLSGNANEAAAQFSVLADVTPPTPVISGPAGPQNASFNVMVDFGETVTGFGLDDIRVGNGSSFDINDLGGGTFSVTISPTTTGTVTVDIDANRAQDAAGNFNSAAIQFSLAADLTAPVPTILGPSDPQNGPFSATIDFSEEVTGFSIGQVALGNASASNLIDNGGGSYTVTVTPAVDGDVTVDFSAGLVQDVAGNLNTAASQFTVAADLTPPVPSISGPIDVQISSFGVGIDFGEAVTGFELEDIRVDNAIASNLLDNGGGAFSVTLTTLEAGPVIVNIDGGLVQDAAGNLNTAASQFVVEDPNPPEPVISGPAAIQSGPFQVHIDFGEDVTGFTVDDLMLENATASDLADNGSGAFSITVSPLASARITVNIPAGLVQDLAGNFNEAANQFGIDTDLDPPEPVISGPAEVQIAPFRVNIDFGEAVTGFGIDTITLSNASASDLVDNGAGAFSVLLTPLDTGSIKVDLGANLVQDIAGNFNTAATQFSVDADPNPPVPVISGPATTGYRSFDIAIDFGEPIVDFALSDMTVNNGTASAFIDHGNGQYSATISPPHEDGSLSVDVNAGVAFDLAGNPNAAAATLRVLVVSDSEGSVDLQITKTNGRSWVNDGETTTYTITVFNAGPSDASGVIISDILPSDLINAHWACLPMGSASCSPEGTGDIEDLANIPVNDAVVYNLTATVDSKANTVTNTAIVITPDTLTELDFSNNLSTDTDTISMFRDSFGESPP